jgi:two-component system phosphate regulon sensor histidine kinase PhoR
MAAVYGAALTLLRPDVALAPPQKRELLEMIASQAERLRQITEEVLLAAQLDRAELTLERESVDIGELAQATVTAMRTQVPQRSDVAVEITPDVGSASGSRDRIQQVLVNLLDNAFKYGGDGPVTVRVEGSNGTVRILVADAGPGIAFAEQERIFEKFYRGDPQLTRAPSGTGLGLYIARELVQRMGGRLDVQSDLGAGATFVVELPRG